MKRSHLFALFEQAQKLSEHQDFVVVGSLAILGTQDEGELPADMCMSVDIDCYTKADPSRILDLQGALGEGSVFHRAHGYYLDPVSPSLPSLPDGWEGRMTCLTQDGLRLWFLDPDDTAISKYARSQPNDLRWIRAGLLSGLISLPRVIARLPSTVFLDEAEGAVVRQQVNADRIWLDEIRRPHARDLTNKKAT